MRFFSFLALNVDLFLKITSPIIKTDCGTNIFGKTFVQQSVSCFIPFHATGLIIYIPSKVIKKRGVF